MRRLNSSSSGHSSWRDGFRSGLGDIPMPGTNGSIRAQACGLALSGYCGLSEPLVQMPGWKKGYSTLPRRHLRESIPALGHRK